MTELALPQPDDDAAEPFLLTRRECLIYGGSAALLSALPLLSISAPVEVEPMPPPLNAGFRRISFDK